VTVSSAAAPEPESTPEKPATVEQKIAPEKASSHTLGWIAGGVGIAGLATAGVFWVLRGGTIRDLDDMCAGKTCPPRAQDTIDRGRLYTGVAEAGLAVGVVGLAVGAGILLTGSGSETNGEAKPSVAVVAGPGAVHVLGRF
jgi:hypothetical protein